MWNCGGLSGASKAAPSPTPGPTAGTAAGTSLLTRLWKNWRERCAPRPHVPESSSSPTILPILASRAIGGTEPIRPRSSASCSTCSRSTPATSVTWTSSANSPVARPGSDARPGQRMLGRSQSEDVRDEYLRGALVGRVGGGKELGHGAFLDDGADEEVGADDRDRDQPVGADRYRRADHAKNDAAVDGVADPPVGAGRDQLGVGLLRHRHAPVAAQVHPGPDGERQAEDEDHQAGAEHPLIVRTRPVALEDP